MMKPVRGIRFILHNEEHKVQEMDAHPRTTLLQYLREHENLKGTKYMCLEGGCGACVVSVTTQHPLTKQIITFSVNSCLVSVYSCDGWRIETVDGIGNQLSGYHPIQRILAEDNGTQCGFCSPGMVMNMYALLKHNSKVSKKQIEDSFGGNMCRCTGYRPILTAFRRLCDDVEKGIPKELPDIEELTRCETQNCQKTCQILCSKNNTSIPHVSISDPSWFKVFSINEIFDVLIDYPNLPYQLVAGNTAKGVYHNFNSHAQLFIDITDVTHLLDDTFTSDSCIIGANKTLADTIEFFEEASSADGFNYLQSMANHIKLIAHVSVRNIGTLAGNLSIKHEYNEFPSDIFLILETVGANLTIAINKTKEEQHSVLNYLQYSMRRKIIKNIILPRLDKSYRYRSYKITPRAQNAHAMVNAGFLLKLDSQQTVQEARIVYGGIDPNFVHATKTEKYIIGKDVFNNNTLQDIFKALDEDIQPDDVLPQPSPTFRKKLAIALFYKFILSIAPDDKISPRNKSGGSVLVRPLSIGAQDFQSNETLYPLTQPIPKVEALEQTSGEAEYITDIPEGKGQLYATFVTADAPANSIITKIDPSQALNYEGVVSFYSAKDIPGANTFIPLNANYPVEVIANARLIVPEELFCSGVVRYYFQPVGVIIATTQEIADKAAELVNVTYNAGTKKPLLSIRQVVASGEANRIFEEGRKTATRRGNDITRVIRGSYDTTWQYHYHMETQICAVFPNEDELDIYPGTQWMDMIQVAVAQILNINENRINVKVKRVGGAYGAKITRNSLIACAAALAAYKLNRPVRMRMSFSQNMDVIGKRFPASADYEVGVNDRGEIQYLNCTFYLDYATGGNEPIVNKAIDIFSTSYQNDTWTVIGNNARSDRHAAVWTRAPGHTNVMAMIESIMEHLSMELNIPSLDFRLINISRVQDNKINQFINECRKWSDYDNRLEEIKNFNKNNRWKKKGISLVPMTYPFMYFGSMNSMVAVYAADGSVAVSHGGIEVGQGINTKVAQVCAFALGISVNMVSVKASNNMVSPNNFTTGASLASEEATLRACETLLARMQPIRQRMNNPTWKELVRECQNQYVELVAHHMFSPNDPPRAYNIYGVCVSEVEIDILTGTHQVNKVHLLEDTGTALSPLVDIGQLEGAFVMGLGFWTTEKLVYDENGRLLTNRTWNYKIPGFKDIPIEFKVSISKNNLNPQGVLNSKATGEPSLCLSCSIPLAIRQAVASARTEAKPTVSKWYPFDGPSDVEHTFLNSLHDYHQYAL